MSEQGANSEGTGEDEHVPPKQLFALVWANQESLPRDGDPDADLELVRLRDDLEERYQRSLNPAHRLGPETATRLWAHALECRSCRMMLLEDAPSAKPPKTVDEAAKEEQKKIDDHQKQLIKFWTSLVIGCVAFGVAVYFINWIRGDAIQGPIDGAIGRDPRDKAFSLDPRYIGFAMAILTASWFLAEAYTVARNLWVDFTAWKRAVPVIGEWWVGKSPESGGDDMPDDTPIQAPDAEPDKTTGPPGE